MECELWGHYTLWNSGEVTLDYTYWICGCNETSIIIGNGTLVVKGNCGEEGGVAPGDPNCQMSLNDVREVIANASFSPSDDAFYTYGPEETDVNSNILRPVVAEWKFGTFTVGLNTLGFSAFFAGKIEKPNTPNAVWKWNDFAYSNTAHTSGTDGPCTTAETSAACSTTMEPDGSVARTALAFTMKAKVVCVSGSLQRAPRTENLTGTFYPTYP